ncbi:S8 family serine peptidase [Rhodoligotrophos defluvii]|uniref:S8 family serine peptidase n=1 Tax=Rhodoligotrophos defluvii TaxID=2561934 RepID=UPI0010CA1984|nr:S8 family serine peptidase [Rhodoligotrophos defluvii]
MNRRIGLLFLVTVLALAHLPSLEPGGFGFPQALADDDDDDDDDRYEDDDDDDDDERRPRRSPRAIGRGADDDDDDDDAPTPAPEFVIAVPDAALLGQIAALGYTVVQSERLELLAADVARLQPPAGTSLAAARAEIAALSPEALLDLNSLYRPNDFLCEAGTCAAFEMAGWPKGQSCAFDGSGEAPLIGMIDTTVNPDHPSLAAGSVETAGVIGAGRKPASAMHGTAIALMFAGAADSRTPGLLPGVRLIAAEAFHRNSQGQDVADAFDLVRAMNLLAERRVAVVNMSLSGPENRLMERALAALVQRGIPVAAAAGNGGRFAKPLYPAAYDDAIAVTAVDRRGAVYRQANRGSYVDFAAPGVRLWTAASISGGRLRSGTSYAVPFVTAALVLERRGNPGLAPAELEKRLAARARDLGPEGRDDTFGWGLVQLPPCDGTTGDPISPAASGG